GFGYADLRARRAADAATVYHLFSGTKLFTAAAILQLVDGGKLRLDANVSECLPQIAGLHNITVRMLLSHSSGLKDTIRGFLAVYFPGEDAPSTSQALANYKLQIRGAPGGRARYGNVNYALLGEIVSEMSGTSYREYVRRHILAP